MEVISIDGTEYLKASLIAKRFRYTNDYVGQLCRGGKVDAKLVGRTWYVNPLSIEGHKTTRYSKTSLNEKSISEATVRQAAGKAVESVPRKGSMKYAGDVSINNPSYLKRVVWQPVKYEHDTSELLPPLKPVSEPISVPVMIAEAEKLPIRNLSSVTKLETEPLPEFLLQGGIKVRSIDDNFDNNEENIAIPESLKAEEAAHLVVDEVGKSNHKVKIQKPNKRIAESGALVDKKDKYSYPVMITVEEKPALNVDHAHPLFVPDRVRHKAEVNILESEQENSSRRTLLTLLTLGVLGVVAACLLVTIEKVITVDKTDHTSTLEFNFSLSKLLEDFSKK